MPTAVQEPEAQAGKNQPRTTGARLTLNSVSNVSVNLLTAGVSVFLTPFILRQLGDQRYGVWAVLASFYSYSMLLSLGLYSALSRHIPVHLAHGRSDKIREVTSTTTAFFVTMSLVLLGLTFVAGDRALGFLVMPAALRGSARWALYTVGIVASLCLSLNSFGAVLSGYQRYELMALGRLVAIGLRVGLVLAFLSRSAALVAMAFIFGATEVLVGVFNLGFAWRLIPERSLQWKAIRWEVLREMFGYGLNTLIYAVGALAVAKTGEIVIGTYMPPEHITYYTLALMPPMMLSGLVESSLGAVMPAVADLDSRNDVQKIRELTLFAQKSVLLFMLATMAFFVVTGGDFYRVWLHRAVPQAVRLLPVLGVGYLVHAAQFPLFLVLAGRGDHRAFGLLTVVMGASAVGLEVLFCHVAGLGNLGVAIGSSCALIAVSGVVLPLHAARRLGMPLTEFVLKAWLPALFGAMPAVLVLVLWKSWWPPQTLLGLVLGAAITGVVLAGSAWFLALNPLERRRFRTVADSTRERFARVPVLGRLTRLGRVPEVS